MKKVAIQRPFAVVKQAKVVRLRPLVASSVAAALLDLRRQEHRIHLVRKLESVAHKKLEKAVYRQKVGVKRPLLVALVQRTGPLYPPLLKWKSQLLPP